MERVREGLRFVEVGDGEKDGLVAWMCVVCAAVSKGEMREGFVRKLVRMGWHYDREEKTGMDRLLRLGNVFGKGCIEKIWEEVRMIPRTVVAENLCQSSTS